MSSMMGVLLTAYGSPPRGGVREYLRDIMGREPTEAQVEDLRRRYKAIGGSPLLEVTRRQASALEDALSESGDQFKVYVGMKHWHPFVGEAVEDMVRDSVERAVVIPLAPHYSKMSTEGYREAVEDALEKEEDPFDFHFVESYHDHPMLVYAWTSRIRSAESKLGDKEPTVVFTAHSLPKKILTWNDPYPDQILETCREISRSLPFDWRLGYQSAGRGRGEWLGPPVRDVMESLHDEGVDHVVVAPVGFVSDHLEILYDIDVECAEFAEELGMEMVRAESLNDDPKFIELLASLARRELGIRTTEGDVESLR